MTKTRALVLSLFALVAVSCKKEKKADEAPAATAAAPADPGSAAATPTPDPGSAAAAAPATTGVASIAIPQAKSTTDGVLTGGQPTPENLAQFKEQGVKTVVNLRSAAEEKDFADEAKTLEAAGIKYVHIPIDGKTGEGINEENAKKLAELMAEKPVVVHCASGQRVGALIAMKAKVVDGKTPEEALAIGQENGLSKPELVAITAEKLGAKTDAAAAKPTEEPAK